MSALAISKFELPESLTYPTSRPLQAQTLNRSNAIPIVRVLDRSPAGPDVSTYLALKLLEAYEKLEDDWDCEGAHRINEDTIKHCKQIIKVLPRSIARADITPNNNGTISFEWASTTGKAHLEVGKEEFSFYLKPKFGRTIYARGEATKWSNYYIAKSFDSMLQEYLFPTPATHQVSSIVFSAANADTATYYVGNLYAEA